MPVKTPVLVFIQIFMQKHQMQAEIIAVTH